MKTQSKQCKGFRGGHNYIRVVNHDWKPDPRVDYMAAFYLGWTPNRTMTICSQCRKKP